MPLENLRAEVVRACALVALALVLVLGAAPAAARCLRFEPATVTLTGTLTERVMAGPPNYDHIARGDIPEKVLFIELERPICVTGDPMLLRNTGTLAGIEEVQVRMPTYWRRSLIGKRVSATGTLFTAHSRAHRTPAVLTAIGVREAD